MPELLNLPNELLILIGHNLTDPSDILSLRLTHPLFDFLLAAHFTCLFRGQDYMEGVSPDCEVVIIDAQLLWAAQNNHLHFAASLMRKVNLGDDSGRGGKMRLMACFLGLQDEALRSAVRKGHMQMLELLLGFVAERAPGNLEAAWKDCWEVTLKEDNAEMAKWVLKEGPWETEDAVNSAMKMAREAKMWEVAEFAYGIGHERFGRGWRRRGKGKQ